MVDRYLEKGNMYVLEDGNVKAECVVTDEGNEILEIKNIDNSRKRHASIFRYSDHRTALRSD